MIPILAVVTITDLLGMLVLVVGMGVIFYSNLEH